MTVRLPTPPPPLSAPLRLLPDEAIDLFEYCPGTLGDGGAWPSDRLIFRLVFVRVFSCKYKIRVCGVSVSVSARSMVYIW